MKNEIKNPMERYISNTEINLFGDGGVSDCDDCNNPAPEKPGHTGTFICSHCGGEFSVNEQNYVDPENTVCNACYAEINSCFVCSKCGYYRPCSFESAEEGVCKNCYVPPEPDPVLPDSPEDDPTDTPTGGTTDDPTDTEDTDTPKDGVTTFICKLCGQPCSCNNRSGYDDVCCYCAPNAFCCEACGEVKYKSDMYGSSGVCKDCRNTASLSIDGPDSIGTGSSGGSYFATLSCSFDYVPDYLWSVQSNTGDFSITGAGVLTAAAAGVATVTVRERKLGLIANKTVSSARVNMCPYCTNSVTAANRYLDTDVCNECATNVPIWYTPSINIIKDYEGTVRLNFSRNVYMPCSFESSDENVATAEIETIGNSLGIVRVLAKTPGTATITARIGLNGKTDTITVNVIDDMVVTPSATIIDAGETVTLSTQINDERYNCCVDYVIADTNVLRVGNSNNKFVAIKPGKTEIKVRAYGGDNTYIYKRIEVTVRGLIISNDEKVIVVDNGEIELSCNCYGVSESNVIWSVSDDSIAAIVSSEVIRLIPKEQGLITITAQTQLENGRMFYDVKNMLVMDIVENYLTNNPAYTLQRPIGDVKGIIVHSTGVNLPELHWYCDNAELFGVPEYVTNWNREDVKMCVHAFIGYDKNYKIRIAKTLPYEYACHGAGNGTMRSFNYSPNGHVQFEMCEDFSWDKYQEGNYEITQANRVYFSEIYRKAVEYCAYLCIILDLHPSTIKSHNEVCDIYNNSDYYKDVDKHVDPLHWFEIHDPVNGKNMEKFKTEVSELLAML